MQVNDFHLLMAEVFSKMLHSDSFCFLYFALLSFFFKAVCFKLCQGQSFFSFIGRFHSSFETSIAVKMLVYVRILGKLYDQ